MNQAINNKTIENEMDLKDFFTMILSYKWFIFLMIFLSLALSNIYLFFKPIIYSTSAKIEVITYDKSNQATNDLLQNTFYANKEVDKEIDKLTTYKINQKVIDMMKLQTQYFLSKGYGKYSEIYGDEISINIKIVKTPKDEILGRMIKLIPKKDSYSLEVVNNYREKLTHLLFKKEILKIDNRNFFEYGKVIKTKYFELSIKKIKELKEPIYFKIYGNSRDIYERFINNRLMVKQENREAPILEVFYEDNIPQRATQYINRLITVFKEEGKIQKSKRNNQLSAFIKKELIKNSKELKKAEKALERYKIKNRVIEASGQASLIVKDLNEIEISISKNELQEMMVNSVLEIIKNEERLDSIGPLLVELGDRISLAYLEILGKLELEEHKFKAEYTEEYPELMMVRKQIDIMKEKVYSNVKSLKSSILDKKINLEKLKREKENEFKQLPIDETNIVNLDRKYKLLLKMNDYLSQKEKENSTIKAAIISDYSIVEQAYLPKIPIKPKRSLIQILSLILGLLVGVILALIHNSLNDKIKNKMDIEKTTILELYGVIPFIKRQKNRRVEVFNNPQSYFTDAYRKLRTDLQFLSKSNIVLITSMMPKVGKSTVVANLSAIFQLGGFKSIVIDLNLQEPTLHKYFGIEYGIGISSYLSGKANLSDIIFPSAEPNLDVIPAGNIPSNPSELMLSNRLKIMFSKLKEEYDYIFLDTASIDLQTDTLLLMRYSDINFIVLRKKYSKKSSILKLEKMIAKYDIQNTAFIMNMANKDDEN